MNPPKAFGVDAVPLTRASSADNDRITPEQYAAAYAAGCTRTARLLISRGCSPPLAEETAQSAWSRGWEHRSKLRETEKVLQWVNSIAFNLLRSEFRRREVAAPEVDLPIMPRTGPEVVDSQRILEHCSPTERELLRKHYSVGYTSKEIAQQMNCSPSTVRVRLMRLKSRIRMVMTARPVGAAQTCP